MYDLFFIIEADLQAICGEPDFLENGSASAVLNDPSGLLTVRYGCANGFTAIGRQQVRCIHGVGWEPLEMQCVSKYASMLAYLMNRVYLDLKVL